MKTFRIIASKNNNKVTLINQYESLEEARYDVGRQGYAIIEIGELKEGFTLEGIFYFEIQTSDGIRKGKIKSDDIFKAYVKLIDDLGYKVLFIYDRADATDEYKKLMTVNIEKSYYIYQEQSGKKRADDKIASALSKDASGSFAAQKEIERLQAVYAKMLIKAESILNTYRDDLSADLRNDLSEIITRIKTVGTVSNITRLRAFGEDSLRKIGEAELFIINKRSIAQKKEFLEETNKLLKGIGSRHPIVHADDSLQGNLKKLLGPLFERFKKTKAPVKINTPPSSTVTPVLVTQAGNGATYRSPQSVVKKGSYLYYHVLKDIETYQKKQKAIYHEWLHALFRLDSEGIRHKRIKLDLISQNIRLLRARLSGHVFSYTKVIQGIQFYINAIFGLVQGLADLCVTVFAIFALYFAFEYTFGAFFAQELFLHPSFIYTLVVIAGAAVTIKSCVKAWQIAPAGVAFFGFLLLLQINF